jgi:hypothetical protein
LRTPAEGDSTGNAVTFYALLMFITPDKVGLLINEFSKGDVGK